tara:strand:+ start:729 stop:1061 length:333 start_codon:yes stop_codon:yes gene_type:complete
MAENKGARSYKGEVIGDSMAITINFKWLLQILGATALLVYTFWQYEGRIQELERNMTIALEDIAIFEEERAMEEAERVRQLEEQMQEQTVWIEQELGINLNPFSWGKGKK